jgi:hypothetical protein
VFAEERIFAGKGKGRKAGRRKRGVGEGFRGEKREQRERED